MASAARSPGRSRSKRIALIHVAKKQLGLGEDDFRDILQRFGGVQSCADLDEEGFRAVMFRFEQLGFRSTKSTFNFGNRHGMATPAQVSLMRDLWAAYSADDPDERHLNAWLAKYHKVSALRFVSFDKAAKIIPALKAMAARVQHDAGTDK